MRNKLKFNPETLNYEYDKKSHGFNFSNLLWIIFSAIGIGFLISLIVIYFFPSPKEKQLRYDLSILKKNYSEVDKKFKESMVLYEKMIDKEKELQKMTFETEIEEQPVLRSELNIPYDFNFQELINFTTNQLNIASLHTKNLVSRTKSLLHISNTKRAFIENLPSILPVEKDKMVLVSGYGRRIHPIFKTEVAHNGIDFAARTGIPVMATANGTVVAPPSSLDHLGNVVVIDHGFGYTTIYGCLLKPEVRKGQKVKKGQVIGYVGKSGMASGPHLHYEVWKNGKPVNPINYFFLSLKPEEYKLIRTKTRIKNQCMS